MIGAFYIISYINNLLPNNEVLGLALRRVVPMYPEIAVRELVANAIIHQNFFMQGTSPLIEIFTDEGDVVIDPCCGSGSTLRAAHELGRSAYGFEIDRNFYNRAKEEMLSFDQTEQISIEMFPEVMP